MLCDDCRNKAECVAHGRDKPHSLHYGTAFCTGFCKDYEKNVTLADFEKPHDVMDEILDKSRR